jgi:glycosyltransferase involved in cell wall biosynthesis
LTFPFGNSGVAVKIFLKRKLRSVFYLTPDSNRPSWGIGLIYSHVKLLRQHGVNAYVLHHKSPFSITWFDAEVPVIHLDNPSLRILESDILVVPEILAREGQDVGGKCLKIVFVQGSFLILQPFEDAIEYPTLGYDVALVIMPHTQEIVERFFGLEARVVPPFVESYFFSSQEELFTKRDRRVLIFPKSGYREAGYCDYDIVKKLLRRRCKRRERKKEQWEFLEVYGRTHREVAALMRKSAFLVSVNCLEAFNTTVPEAMAAGCIPVCYEAYGGKDFLATGTNAYVFPNNYVYPLTGALLELMENYDSLQDELSRVRANAHRSACRYRIEETAQALGNFYRSLGIRVSCDGVA